MIGKLTLIAALILGLASCGGSGKNDPPNSASSSNSSSATSGSSTSSGSTSLTIQPNDVGFCSLLGHVENQHDGYSGSGYANSNNQKNASISWLINVPTTGEFTLTWRYANSDSQARPALLTVTHNEQSTLDFNTTGSWSEWREESLRVHLEGGDNYIALGATSNLGLANVDALQVTGGTAFMGDCDSYAPNANRLFIAPTFRDQSVHDPSVIKVDETYYVFGSHLAAAKSTDLTRWTQVANGVNARNPLIENVASELAEALSWAETDTLWAADVVRLPNGQFAMYYNACRGDSPLSAMGIATANHVEGPYRDAGVFLRSGMWDQTSEDGTIYNAQHHPNAVDPHAFYDQNGKFWLIYGSYSGGIFIMELDPVLGFPLPGQGYGQHLVGGNHARIEGAYVLYSPQSEYYYLFLSYGGLDADGAYNIRVVRSRNPNGPYEDAEGHAMSQVKADPSAPLFDDASIAPYGVKLMGNHVFADTNNQLGYVSPGHNTAYFDADNDRYQLIFHTRFPGRGELHEIRVHEFMINAEGWPVVSPLRYAPRLTADNNLSSEALEFVGSGEMSGRYQMINHGKDISTTIKSSSNIQLHPNRTITGVDDGQWTYTGNNGIELVINGHRYSGVVSRQWNQYHADFQITFSALSDRGEAIWGIARED